MNDKSDITIYESLILMGLAGTKMRVEKRGDFKPLVVRKSFNADEGSFVSVISPNSAYASGYKHMEVEFFYKKQQGICVRTFLYNDPAFIGEDNKNESEFYKNYASFKFMKKKRNGSYKKN